MFFWPLGCWDAVSDSERFLVLAGRCGAYLGCRGRTGRLSGVSGHVGMWSVVWLGCVVVAGSGFFSPETLSLMVRT